jgi:thiol:disulfide interchange protein DsbC
MLKKYCSVLLTALLLAPLANAANEKPGTPLVVRKSPEAIILEKLKQARPDLSFSDPRPSPVKGLYQVQMIGGPLLYVTPEGDKFIAGELFSIDLNGYSRFEDPYVVEERKRLLASVKPEDSIIFKPKGKTKAVVYVFTDVDCGYCRLLHRQIHTYKEGAQELPGYNDLGIEIRYLAYPRAGIPSQSADKLITAWCAKDKQKMLTSLKNEEPLQANLCEKNPVAAQFKLGADVGVSGTPAVWFPDGKLVPGYMPPADMAKSLGIQ